MITDLGDVGPIDEPPPTCPDCDREVSPVFNTVMVGDVQASIQVGITCYNCQPIYGPSPSDKWFEALDTVDEIPF